MGTEQELGESPSPTNEREKPLKKLLALLRYYFLGQTSTREKPLSSEQKKSAEALLRQVFERPISGEELNQLLTQIPGFTRDTTAVQTRLQYFGTIQLTELVAMREAKNSTDPAVLVIELLAQLGKEEAPKTADRKTSENDVFTVEPSYRPLSRVNRRRTDRIDSSTAETLLVTRLNQIVLAIQANSEIRDQCRITNGDMKGEIDFDRVGEIALTILKRFVYDELLENSQNKTLQEKISQQAPDFIFALKANYARLNNEVQALAATELPVA
jgi:hypothetical protein